MSTQRSTRNKSIPKTYVRSGGMGVLELGSHKDNLTNLWGRTELGGKMMFRGVDLAFG